MANFSTGGILLDITIIGKDNVKGYLDTVCRQIYNDDSYERGLAVMICPVCRSDMIDVEYNRIELDYCTVCRGVWFDTEELELLIESMGLEETGLAVDSIVGSPEAETSEKGRKCPICGQKMGKAHIGQEPRILIDVCWGGDGLWFDGGEVSQLIKQLIKRPPKKGDSQQQVITFLGEVFGAKE